MNFWIRCRRQRSYGRLNSLLAWNVAFAGSLLHITIASVVNWGPSLDVVAALPAQFINLICPIIPGLVQSSSFSSAL
jgi:hypothetical protein